LTSTPIPYLLLATAIALSSTQVRAESPILIDHRYTNTDAQSLIGLPLGSHKTIVDKSGNLKWSQWSLKRKPLDTPIGFSSQMDGELAIQPFAGSDNAPLKMQSQALYQGRYPFIVTKFSTGDVALEELAFAVDPDQDPAKLPTAKSGTHALDVVRLIFTNNGATSTSVLFKLSCRTRNLPGHASATGLFTKSGENVVLIDNPDAFKTEPEDASLTLALSTSIAPRSSKSLWLRLPYEFPVSRNAELTKLSGDALLAKATTQWDQIWARGTRIHYPSQQLNDFFHSSIAYVLILTEYDTQGDLWALDGPAVYRQYWGRGEFFQARAMEVAGYLDPARESIEHAFHIQNDDGEWDGPPVSGWPAWDNSGGNAGAVWDYYLYTRNATWLAKAYPHLLAASEWIKAHREETTLEDVTSTPVGARPIKRMLTGSKCRTEPTPPLVPGEKTYWYGLLPWSYGDSGLPEGHSYSHNFLAAYAVRVTAEAARVLNKPEDAAWLDQEYTAYTGDIRASVERSIALEKTTPKYLPAMPTYPEGAYSQTFLAISPTQIYAPDDPLVTGLLTRMESEKSQGLPTNVAWAGPAGVWPGEAMNMAETYLLRDDAQHTTDMLLAALNHSYTTNVFKEEILTDVTKERACETPHSKRENMQGTGDMPEAWGNANVVNLLRDMLVQERRPAPGQAGNPTVHFFAGLLANWIGTGEDFSITNAPTTLGTTVSARLHSISSTSIQITIDPGSKPTDLIVHIAVAANQTIKSIRIDGKPAAPAAILTLPAVSKTVTIDVEMK
jgi:GH15 family glucan-1,4-alpha-glucosidase